MLGFSRGHATILDFLLEPVTAEEFLAEWHERRALHAPGLADRFAGLFDRRALERAIHHGSLGPYDLRAAWDDRGRHGEMPLAPRDAASAFSAGLTVCAQAIDRADAHLAAFVAELRAQFAAVAPVQGRFEFNCYLSPDGRGFGTHFDDHAVWILQLEGAKRWRFSETPALPHPTRGTALPPHGAVPCEPWERVERPDEAAFGEALLEPGHVLYLPAGCWHRARAVGTSLALTLRGPRLTTLGLFQAALRPRLLGSEGWRRAVPFVPRERLARGEAPAELWRDLERRLAELQAEVAALTPLDLAREWYRGVSTSTPRPRDDVARLLPEDELRWAGGAPPTWLADPVTGGAWLYANGQELGLAPEAVPFLRRLASSNSFVAADATKWVPGLPWDGEVAPLLRSLVGLGVLERRSRSRGAVVSAGGGGQEAGL